MSDLFCSLCNLTIPTIKAAKMIIRASTTATGIHHGLEAVFILRFSSRKKKERKTDRSAGRKLTFQLVRKIKEETQF